MAAPQMDGLAAQGLQPAGMLRICKGQQERYVWPVHLPGWLAVGWRVAGAAVEPVPRPVVVPAVEPAPEPPSEPEPVRGKRGRKRKEESSGAAAPEPVAVVEPEPEPDSQLLEELDASPAQEESPTPADEAFEAALDPDEAGEIPMLTALPDDLFDDPLI